MNPTAILIIVALVGPFASWGLTALNGKWARDAAVLVAEEKASAACAARVTSVQTEINNKAAENIRLADEAVRILAPTPAEAAELADLCNASASCRDRKKETKK